MIKWFKNFISEWSERLEYDGLTYEEVCKYAGGGGKGGGSSQREVTPEERALWDSQRANLDAMTKIAQDQYNISQEDRSYYEKVFREGTDTEAKTALAKLKSQITGETVKPEDIKSVNADSLLRDTILNATPEFQQAATKVIESNQALTSKYGADATGLSKTFTDTLGNLSTNYAKDLQTAKEQTGTINQDVLSRETGAALGGVSTSYNEARKQMTSDLARRGLAGSGVEANILAQNYQAEAMAKANAIYGARTNALNQSEAIRQQQLALSGQQYQLGANTAQTQYNANLGAIQNVYGVTTASDLQNYQTSNAATLQSIAGLSQLASAGQGLYTGAQNYLAQAGSTSGQAAQIAGSSASNLAQVNSNYALQQQANANASAAGIGKLVGTLGGAYLGSASGSTALTGGLSSLGTSVAGLFSDIRLKTNIQLVDNINGYNIYTWDWIEGYDYGYNKGVLAQEIMETNPEAVSLMDNGYYQVNYSKLGLEALIQGVNNGF